MHNYRLIAVDLSKQKSLDTDPRAIQQIVFERVVGGADNTKVRRYTMLGKSNDTALELYKGTAKVKLLSVKLSDSQLKNAVKKPNRNNFTNVYQNV